MSPRAWLTRNTSLTDGAARRLVRNARIVDRHETVAVALADGEITTQHVEAMGRVISNDASACSPSTARSWTKTVYPISQKESASPR